jgi:hypothetical protein
VEGWRQRKPPSQSASSLEMKYPFARRSIKVSKILRSNPEKSEYS